MKGLARILAVACTCLAAWPALAVPAFEELLRASPRPLEQVIEPRPALADATAAALPAMGMDLSAQYLQDFPRIDEVLTPARVERLRRYTILVVPGFFTNHYPRYFNEQFAWCRAAGLDCRKTAVNTEVPPLSNLPAIARAVSEADKPVLIVSHSKGSLDTLVFLLARPDLCGKVRGWVSIQGALLGTPVADYIAASPKVDAWAAYILDRLGGTVESLHSMTTAASRKFYQENQKAIAQLVGAVPCIAFASWKDPAPGPPNSLLAIPRNIMTRQGIKNDGLMPAANAVLPGMDFVMVAGVDHADPAMRSIKDYDRLRLTKTLLSLLLQRLEA